jgi:DNA-binding HxlR family transcriptional regulator
VTTDQRLTRIDRDVAACERTRKIVERVGRRWTATVLLAAERGARRFSDYRRMVVGISDRLLSQRLKELEALGVIERQVVPSTPVQIFYRPTPMGAELISALTPLMKWGDRHMG